MRRAPAAITDWAAPRTGRSAALVWVHGASAGELIGVAPVIDELRRRRSFQLLVTHFSPSALPVLPALEPDFASFLPPDSARIMGAALDALRPRLVVFAVAEVWPGLTRAAADRRVPLALVNGIVRPDSHRLAGRGCRLQRRAYARLTRAAAASEEDAARLRALGVRSGALRVTGDAAFDRALARVGKPNNAQSEPPAGRKLRELVGSRRCIVAGSTWPADEGPLLRAVAGLGLPAEQLALIIVPHQPTHRAVGRLEARCAATLGVRPRRWSELPVGAADGEQSAASGTRGPLVLVVDTVGILAELYAAADVAWVGGGFGRTGLHSVIEPAAAGVPVVFGPRHARREARELVACGAARPVEAHQAADVLLDLLTGEDYRRMGEEARRYVEAGAGAAARSARMLAALMSSG